MGIRIIRSTVSSDSNLHAVEREEAIHVVARQIAEATGTATPEHIDECARKLRNVTAAFSSRSPDQMVKDIDTKLHLHSHAKAAHGEIDLERVMQLLEF